MSDWKKLMSTTKAGKNTFSEDGCEAYTLASVKAGTTKTGKPKITYCFDNGNEWTLDQMVVINPDTNEFYGFSADFFTDLCEMFSCSQNELGEELDQAIKKRTQFFIFTYKEPYMNKLGKLSGAKKIFKIMSEAKDVEMWKAKAEAKTKKLSDAFSGGEEEKPKVIMIDDDDDDDIPFK